MKALAVGLVLFFMLAISIFSPPSTYAQQELLWTSAPPTVVKNTALLSNPDNSCPTYRQSIFVVEFGAERNICVYGDERLKIGNFDDGGGRAAVEFPYSNNMHVLEGICGTICRYSADTDVLITQQSVGQYALGLVVYHHVSNRIRQVIVSANTTKYVFDATHPDYEMKNNAGRYVQTRAFNISSNGKWIVAELYNKGIAIVDTDTMSARHITTEGYLYGRGMDPTEELAISDDGKSVVVTGQNTGFHVFDVNADCGQLLVDDLTLQADRTQCPSSDLLLGLLFPNFAAAARPRFYGGGHQMEILVNSWVGGLRRVTFVTSGTKVAHQLKLLSLGDSFSSGEGETDDMYYNPGTNQQFDTCHVSDRAYSGRISVRLGIHSNDAKNIACSGAKIGDIIGSRAGYWGQGNRLGVAGLKLPLADKDNAQEMAVDNFQPGRSLQLAFIERYNPEILTIGIGGNDAGLMGKLRTCAMPGTCEWAQGIGIQETAGEIKRLYGTLGSLFSGVAELMDPSKVFIVGYPDIINPDGACDSVTNYLIDHTERVYIQNSLSYLNKVIHAASDKAGFTYVDIEHSFGAKKICGDSINSAVNVVRIGNDIAVINTLPMLKIIGAESFHPTPFGHTLIADGILMNYPGLIAGLSGESGMDGDIEPDTYWYNPDIPERKIAYATDFVTQQAGDPGLMAIQVPDGTLLPRSVATIEIHSELTRLATFIVNEKGGLSGFVVTPKDLDEGFHTLHLLGMNRGGDSIDMYQFLTVGQSGSVLEVSRGEGSTVSDTRSTGSSLSTLHQEYDNAMPLNAAGVLGIQSTTGIASEIEKILSPAVAYAKEQAKGIWWLFFILIIIMVTIPLTISTIILHRKWAKPGS